jgi:hypothetical protein
VTLGKVPIRDSNNRVNWKLLLVDLAKIQYAHDGESDQLSCKLLCPKLQTVQGRVYLLVECRGLNVEGEGKKSRARVKSRG